MVSAGQQEQEVPANANEHCVGPSAPQAGKSNGCQGCPNQSACASGAYNSPEAVAKQEKEKETLQSSSLANISHVVLVLSGKGGVGKSTVSSQLCHTLASRGYATGCLDVDVCGPSAPRMLGVLGRKVHDSGSGWTPVYNEHSSVAVMSIAFLLEQQDTAVVWRGPRKNAMIEQFLLKTDWGEGGLDYLIIDTPPGTSDEHISTIQKLQAVGNVSGAIVVTTPEEVSMADVRKELNFCQKTKIPVLGIVENMTQYRTTLKQMKFCDASSNDDKTEHVLELLRTKCPELLDMTAVLDVFPSFGEGARGMAERYNVPYWGNLPLDPNLLKSCENGLCFTEHHPQSTATAPMNALVDKLVEKLPVELVEDGEEEEAPEMDQT